MRFIITFGQAHTHRINEYTFDKDSVGVVEAGNQEEAHSIAMELTNGVFHQCVPEEEYNQKGWAVYFPRGKHPMNFKEVTG